MACSSSEPRLLPCWGSKVTFRHTKLGGTPLDECSPWCRDLYLTTHNTHNRQIRVSVLPAGLEPSPSQRMTTGPRLRPHCHWDRNLMFVFLILFSVLWWKYENSWYNKSLRAWRSGNRIPMGQDFLRPSRPALGITHLPIKWVAVLSRVKTAQGVALTKRPIYRRGQRKSRPKILFPNWTYMAFSMVNFTFTLLYL
jgi:hypothetical protein